MNSVLGSGTTDGVAAVVDDEPYGRHKTNSAHRVNGSLLSLNQFEDSAVSHEHCYDTVLAGVGLAHVTHVAIDDHFNLRCEEHYEAGVTGIEKSQESRIKSQESR